MSEGHVVTSRDIRNALIRWMELPADTTLPMSKICDMMEDSFAKHRAVLAPYYQDMVECIEAQESELVESQARLSEAVKVLGQCRLAFAGYVSVQSAVDMLDNFGTEGQAKAFITTLGGEKMTRPDDIPVTLWDYVLFEVVPNDLIGSYLGRRIQEATCRAIMKATAQAYDDAAKIAEGRIHMFSTDEGLQGRNALKEAASSIRSQAIRQHSQKGEGNE